jgi:hypothetical protein
VLVYHFKGASFGNRLVGALPFTRVAPFVNQICDLLKFTRIKRYCYFILYFLS